MAYTLLEAAKLSRNPLAAAVFRAVATTNELLAVTPMVPKSGESFIYNREKALPTVEFVSPAHGSISESGATFDQVMTALRLIVSDVDTYLFAAEQQDDIFGAMQVQLMKKLKALGRTLGQKQITGAYAGTPVAIGTMSGVTLVSAGPNQDTERHGNAELFYDQSASLMFYRGPGDRTFGEGVNVSADGTYTAKSDNPNKTLTFSVVAASLPGADTDIGISIPSSTNEFDGLLKLTTGSQTVSSSGANGDPLSFDVLDELIDEKVKVRENLYFVMNGTLKRKFYGLVRGLGGTDPQHVSIPGITSPVPTYRGIPILQNDWIPNNETKGSASNLSSVFLASMTAEEGFWMAVGQRGSEVEADLDPRATRIMGVKIRDIGELEGKEARRLRLSWYGASALGSELAVARASELVTS